MWALPTALAALMLAGRLAGNRQALGAAAVLLGNWAFCAAFSELSHDPTSWLSLAAFDYIAAMVLALTMHSRWQIAIVALYALMLCAHVTYSMNQLEWIELSARSYFLTLTALAWAQAASVGGWIVADYYAARRARYLDSRASSADAVSREMEEA